MEDEVCGILRQAKTIAVVGLSEDESRPSYSVARYLQQQGYRIVPVNPFADRVLGEKAYPSLRDIPFPIDIVDVFRRSDQVPSIVDDAIAIGAKAVWMQLGVENEPAAKKARDAGLIVMMDTCLRSEHAFRKQSGQLQRDQ